MTLADILTDPANVAGLEGGVDDRRCKTRRILDNLETRDAAALRDALQQSSGWSAMRLAKTLTVAGHKVSDTSISQHRSQICICSNYETATR